MPPGAVPRGPGGHVANGPWRLDPGRRIGQDEACAGPCAVGELLHPGPGVRVRAAETKLPQAVDNPLRIAAIGLALLAIAGCCAGGTDYLTLSVGEVRANTTIRWGETMQMTDPTFDAAWPRAKDARGEPLEFYVGDERVDVPTERFEVDNQMNNGCGWSDHVEYRLGALGPGTYTVVHRRASGTGDRVSCSGGCPWTTFDGDEALIVTMVVEGIDTADASLDGDEASDAGAAPDAVGTDDAARDAAGDGSNEMGDADDGVNGDAGAPDDASSDDAATGDAATGDAATGDADDADDGSGDAAP